jgi:hypothetical protein
MITNEAGNALAASVAVEPTIATMDATVTTDTAFFDLIATFSSAGPGHGGSQFKPEVTAPGVSIVSAAVGSGTGPLNLQGTSMAAPHVAGVGALLRSKHPEANQAAIKSLIMNGTVDMNPANGLLPLTLQGTGRVDVPTAAGLSSYTTPAGFSFGRINPWKPVSDSQTVAVTNMSDSPRSYSITHVPNQTAPGVSVSCEDSVSVGPNSSASFRVDFSMDPAAGAPDFSGFSQSEVDGWCVLDDGIDTLRVGYLAVVDPASRIQARPYKGDVVLENRGPAAGIAEGFTWLAHGGENLSGTLNSIRETGFRTNSLFGVPVIEFAIATDAPWELLSQHEINIFIDVDKDGSDDVLLQATDWSTYNGTVGVLLTAQFDLVNGGGFLDWLPNTGDYNDSVVALPFTLATGGGLVPDSFDYRIEFDARDGSQDIQYGSVDLADEIIHDSPTVIVGPGEKIVIGRSAGKRPPKTLWFFPSNTTPPAGKQVDFVVGR